MKSCKIDVVCLSSERRSLTWVKMEMTHMVLNDHIVQWCRVE